MSSPSWNQVVRFTVASVLVGVWLSMFVMMGNAIIAAVATETNVAELVTQFGTFLAIVGVLVGVIVKELFQDGGG